MGFEEDILTLASLPTFAELEMEALHQIAALAETWYFRAGEVIFRQHEPSDSGFVVLSGAVVLDASRNGKVSVNIVQPPGVLGQMSINATSTRAATAIALEPSRLLKVSRDLFHRVLEDYPQSADDMRQALAARLRHFAREVKSIKTAAAQRYQSISG
jgi:CRP-like cAMP-binding protein